MEDIRVLVELQSITKRYRTSHGAVVAVKGLQFQLDAGEFVAVCGPSGCGKSTLLLMTGGLLRPDSGRVAIDGQAIYDLNAAERAAFRAETIGFVFQQFHLVPYLSVLDNVLTARLGLSHRSRRESLAYARELLDQFGLTHRQSHQPSQLSTGEKQRTAMARALLNRPRLLLADEPTGNLDPANSDVVLQQLREFAEQGGGVVLVTHDSAAAERADRVVPLQPVASEATSSVV